MSRGVGILPTVDILLFFSIKVMQSFDIAFESFGANYSVCFLRPDFRDCLHYHHPSSSTPLSQSFGSVRGER